MYIARIKIKLEENIEEEYYEKDKWFELFEYKDKKCHWRIKENGVIDFVIGNYQDRYQALEDGKMLYFNILYDLHRNEFGFKLGDFEYVTRMFHDDRGYTLNEFMKNEEWFFNTKNDSADFLGLGVFEINNDIDEYDEYGSICIGELKALRDKPFKFLERINNLNESYKYSPKSQEIFSLISLSEKADMKIKVLLLCQALETMGDNEEKSKEEIQIIDECINYIELSGLTLEQKEPLKNMLRQGKKISSKNKCKKLIEKYCPYQYKQFDKMKVFNDSYTLRGKIIHGEKLTEDTNFSCVYYLKVMVLDILKEWSKEVEND